MLQDHLFPHLTNNNQKKHTHKVIKTVTTAMYHGVRPEKKESKAGFPLATQRDNIQGKDCAQPRILQVFFPSFKIR